MSKVKNKKCLTHEPDYSFSNIAAIDPATIPPRDFMLRDCFGNGLCQRGQLSVVGGHGGGGKSAMTLGQAIALASGKQFGPWKPKQAYRVLIINAEDDEDEQVRRLDAALRSADASGITREDLGDRLQILKCDDIKLIGKDLDSKEILPTTFYAAINKHIRDNQIEYVIYDPLVEMSKGVNENDNGEMNTVVSLMRFVARTNCIHACTVHHFRKGAGASDSGSVRGAGAITALGRINMNLEKLSEADAKEYGISEEDRHNILKLVVAKNNHGPTGSTHFFRIETYDNANGEEETVALEHMPNMARKPVDLTPEKMERFLLRLHRGQVSGDLYSSASSGALGVRAFGLLTQEFGMANKDARQLLQDLERGGIIESVPYQNKDRKQKTGYVVRRWPNGKPEGADQQREIPF